MRRVFVLPVAGMAAVVMASAPLAADAAVGSWSIVSTPDASGSAVASYLEKVACASTTECWAAGFSNDSSFNLSTLMERWDGTSWTVVASPDPGTDNQLWNVACASASECWAVGQASSPPTQTALVARWNGTTWSQLTVPDPSSQDSLQGVTCVSTTDCWAVGFQSGNAATLIEHWNGTAWTVTASPNSASPTNLLQAVTCVSSTECWAVGTQTNTTLVEKWDGTAWTIVSSPNNTSAGIAFNDLFDVTCAAASDCWAVGDATVGATGATSNLVEHWNGSAWSLVTAPDAGGGSGFSYLEGVVCQSATDCWAVGGGGTTTGETLIEQWKGSAWAIVSSPNPASATAGSELLGVTCDSGTCWSVGDGQSATAGDTLAEEYTAPAAAAPVSTPTPTASPTPGSTPSPTPTALPGGRISVPSAGAPPGAAPAAAPLLLLAAGAGCVAAAVILRRRPER
ncbi:MAG TPA: hypothetical protein VFC09_15615 [Candidatus Dormibacteraeota bacterium]|nr:hypothetical protein [Candidatus Dormibacteraeota bacterium]